MLVKCGKANKTGVQEKNMRILADLDCVLGSGRLRLRQCWTLQGGNRAVIALL